MGKEAGSDSLDVEEQKANLRDGSRKTYNMSGWWPSG